MPENNSELGPRLDLAGNPLPPLPGTQPSASNTFSGGPYYPPPAAAPSSGSSYQGRPAPQTSSNSSARLWLRVLVGGISFAAAFTAVSAFTPKHTPAPESFTTYTAPDKSFTCAAPAGWITTAPTAAKMSDGSASTVGGVLFEQNSAKIDITTDNYATLVAYDVMNNNADPQSLTGSKAGVLHKQWRAKTAAEHKGYVEKKIADFDGQMSDARLSEWTARGNALGFGGAMHGYRASFAEGGKTVEVVCQCLDSDWPELKPAFQRVLISFIAGEAPTP